MSSPNYCVVIKYAGGLNHTHHTPRAAYNIYAALGGEMKPLEFYSALEQINGVTLLSNGKPAVKFNKINFTTQPHQDFVGVTTLQDARKY
jgi:hypothetical protein